MNSTAVFQLDQADAYHEWRDIKLAERAREADHLRVELGNADQLSGAERNAILNGCRKHNMVIFSVSALPEDASTMLRQLGEQIGLTRLDLNLRADEDSITRLQVREQTGNQYIPYTNRPLSWHTDGYYNTLEQQVRAIIMYCESPAAEGGENAYLDHELLYIQLRDENPLYIEALMKPDAMTIPANIEDGVEIRPAQAGPVFSVDAGGQLHMRYSARQKNIEWKDDDITQAAARRITELLADNEFILKYRLSAGEGVVCNNVLHNRTGFADGEQQKRLMYRARYYDRVTGIQ